MWATCISLIQQRSGSHEVPTRLWCEPHLDRIHEDAVVRRADLIQLEQIASGYPLVPLPTDQDGQSYLFLGRKSALSP